VNRVTDIEVVLNHAGGLDCHRCGRALLLAVQVPTSVATPEGVATGRRTVELCPRCDRDDPPAQGVLANFAVYDRIEVDTAGQVVRDWIDRIIANPPTYTAADLDADIRDWEAGGM
jgi:hypothetical protein